MLNFANVNEARTNWRPLLHATLHPYAQTLITSAEINSNGPVTVKCVVHTINQHLWNTLYGYGNEESIGFKAGQMPLVYDPMSVIVYGYASYTGVSVPIVDVLRVVGALARLMGIDAWHGDVEDGNHS